MNDFIIDFETLGNKPDTIVVDMSVIVFNPDPNIVQSFDELVASGKRYKFDVKSQRGKRSYNPSTLKWWKEKSEEARKNLVPSEIDMTTDDAIKDVIKFLKDGGVDYKKSYGWCRGQGFDFPIFNDLIRRTFNTVETDKYEPVAFWNQRDIRTAIEAYSMTRGMCVSPLRKGVLDGFVKHDSIHDCAKDIIMLKAAQRYSMGLEDIPNKEDIDPETLRYR